MEIAINGDQAVPMVISHRTLTKPPEILQKRKFVGLVQGLKTLLVKGIELIEESFWEEERTVSDLGESKVVHYALDIYHETDGVNNYPASLRVTQLPGTSRPACGAHFEVIKVEETKAEDKLIRPNEVIRLPKESEPEDEISSPTFDGTSRAKMVGERPTSRPRLPMSRQDLND